MSRKEKIRVRKKGVFYMNQGIDREKRGREQNGKYQYSERKGQRKKARKIGREDL